VSTNLRIEDGGKVQVLASPKRKGERCRLVKRPVGSVQHLLLNIMRLNIDRKRPVTVLEKVQG
jgi:hypothetical protein